jgi:hypothetical protein
MVTYGIDTIGCHVLCSVTINRALGASAGAIVACLTLLDYPASRINNKLAQILQLAQSSPAGPFSSHFDVSLILKVFAFSNEFAVTVPLFLDWYTGFCISGSLVWSQT